MKTVNSTLTSSEKFAVENEVNNFNLYARADVAQQIQDILDENDNNDNENE